MTLIPEDNFLKLFGHNLCCYRLIALRLCQKRCKSRQKKLYEISHSGQFNKILHWKKLCDIDTSGQFHKTFLGVTYTAISILH
jgi:hypothetical protein